MNKFQTDGVFIDLAKLRDYCLNLEHPRGKHKARVFEASLKMGSEQAEELKELIKKGVTSALVSETGRDQYGARYQVDFWVEYNGRQAEIRTIWMVRSGEGFPRLTTCYLK